MSEYFRKLDERKAEGFRGGFEPIPDAGNFRPEIGGDFRRRNRKNVLKQMLLPIEVKAFRETLGTAGRPRDLNRHY